MKKIKVGMAGFGFIGPAHIEALRRIPGIDVVAVSETSEKLAQEKADYWELKSIMEILTNF